MSKILNGEQGSAIQSWSSLPTETVGDFRELGFVHGSNLIPAWGEQDFPHGDAQRAYEIGYDFGRNQHNPETRNYAASEHGHNVGADASPDERREISRRLLNAEEVLAWMSGRDFARHERKYARSV